MPRLGTRTDLRLKGHVDGPVLLLESRRLDTVAFAGLDHAVGATAPYFDGAGHFRLPLPAPRAPDKCLG